MAANKKPAVVSQKVKARDGKLFSSGRKQTDRMQLKFSVCMCLFMFMCFGGRKVQIKNGFTIPSLFCNVEITTPK